MEWLIGSLVIVLLVIVGLLIGKRASDRDEIFKLMVHIEELEVLLETSKKNFKTAHELFDEIADQRDAAHDKIAELEKELDNKTADKKIS